MPIILLAALALAGCHTSAKDQSIEAHDKELVSANQADPAVKQALEDPIMTDPQLATRSNVHAIRPPDEPFSAPLPPGVRGADTPGPPPKTAGQRAWAVLGKPQTRGCDMRVAYSALWATKLPNGLGIYPRGHVIEAAGSDTPTCHLRVVSYRSEADSGAISDFYTQAGRQAGYQVASDQDGLIAQRARDGAMFKVDLTSEDGGGTAVDMVSNAGK